VVFKRVASTNDLLSGEMMSVEIDDVRVLLVKIDGEIYAYDGKCPHKGTLLGDGDLDGTLLVCATHLWEFDACTGEGVNPDDVCLAAFPVQIQDAEIFVEI
jgi:toluene monooxygenase system ferredoxin subunit